MRVIITGRHISVTDAVKAYAREKIERLDRFHRGIDTARLTLQVEHMDCNAEVIFQCARSTFVVHVQSADMYSAVDLLVSKAEKQLRRHKEKTKDKRTGKKIAKTNPKNTGRLTE